MAVKASGTTTRNVGERAKRAELIDNPVNTKPATFRSLAEMVDYLGEALGLRQAYIKARDAYLAGDPNDPENPEPTPWYDWKVKGPRSITFRVNFPDGTSIGSTGQNRKSAVEGVMRKLPGVLEDAKAKKALDSIIKNPPKSVWASADDAEESE